MRPTERWASPRVALVTGGARGIGRMCALRLAEKDFSIALVDLLVPEMEQVRQEIERLGGRAICLKADVADHARAKEVVGEVQARLGRVDFLLNDAGRPMPKGILEITEDEFDRTIAINLKSCFNYIQPTAKLMLAAGEGRIVCMSSLNAYSGGVTAAVSRFAYAAAKAGILGMVRALAKELGPQIHINAICPGLIATEVPKNDVIVARGAEIAENGIALKRIGSTDDVAQLVTFLATSDPCFITGQAFVVDGFQFQM
ncbi:3-oxoacyl-[acyl-carrier protein] reductase [Granulicella rosea]|uniref:3-oxoacyl-[acyl-carrier protein] reductase n=1 Tax=Granulicella rosea TaxID=474952 RepID=A0A239EPH0_9BACT|nr:SDR family NAD(P)-dependent oxidoreductase [Granulicella rosea]SNS46469.1 3-oxoacyl-[acyl-carrier protein] reductase [Granulicella rosea]